MVWFVRNRAVRATPFIFLRVSGGAVLDKSTAPQGGASARKKEGKWEVRRRRGEMKKCKERREEGW